MGFAVDDGPHGPASDAAVRALGQRVLDAYGLDARDVQSVVVELTAYGVPLVCVRLLLTPAALDAMRAEP